MKKKKEEVEAQKKRMVEKVQRKHRKPVCFEAKRVCERKGKKKGRPTLQSETDLGKDWEDGTLSLCFWDRIGIVSMLQQKDYRKGRR